MKVVITEKIRRGIFERIRDCHLGPNKCEDRPLRFVFCPVYIHTLKKPCRNAPCVKLKLTRSPANRFYWYKFWSIRGVGADLFSLLEKYSTCAVVDAYYNFLEVKKLGQIAASEVITIVRSSFARCMIPVEVSTNNNPRLSCSYFATLPNLQYCRHLTFRPVF